MGNQSNDMPQGHKIILIDNTLTRVGTYADALRRRFPNIGTKEVTKVDTSKVDNMKPNDYNAQPNWAQLDTPSIVSNKSQQKKSGTVQGSQKKTTLQVNENYGITQQDPLKTETTEKIQMIDDTEVRLKAPKNSTPTATSTENQEAQIKHMEKHIDQMFRQKTEEMHQMTQAIMSNIQNSIDETVDAILEKKLNTVTNLMANQVTNKIMRAINRRMQNQSENIDEEHTDIEPITQDQSPGGIEFSHKVQKPNAKWNSPEVQHKTQYDMLSALNQIETNLTKTNDSPHDANNTESFLTQR